MTIATASVSGSTKQPPFQQPAAKPDPTLPGQAEGDFVIKDVRFSNGETLPEARLHYTTLGTPHKDGKGNIDNAILLLHGTTSRGNSFFAESFRDGMFGPGKPFDTSKYFVILPDNLGAGQSSKPSEQLHARFPHYAYTDLVELQHRLVTEKLGITHLRVVAGTSMGGMHSWMWGEKYPEAMDALIPIASEPARIAGRNLLWRRMLIEATTSDPEYKGGDYTEPPRGYLQLLPVFSFMTDSPQHLQETIPGIERATEYIHGGFAGGRPILDANDAIYAIDSSRDYDPEPDLPKIKAKVLAINFADDALNPPELGRLQHLVPKVPGARFVIVPASEKTRGHMTLMQAAEWQSHVASFMQKL